MLKEVYTQSTVFFFKPKRSKNVVQLNKDYLVFILYIYIAGIVNFSLKIISIK